MDLLPNLLYYMLMSQSHLEFISSGLRPHYCSTIERVFVGYYGIQFADMGGVELIIDGNSYILEGKWCWCTYPGPHFVYGPSKTHGFWRHRFVTFHGPRLDGWIDDGLLPFAPQQLQASTDFGVRMDNLRMLIDSASRLSVLSAMNELEKMLIDLAVARVSREESGSWGTIDTDERGLRD